MSRTVRGALVQASWTGDKESMIQKHEERAHEAAKEGAQFVLFQELFYGPYFCQVQDAQYYDYTERIPDGPTTKRMQALAKETGMVVIAPMYEVDEKASGIYYNTAAVIDADGTFLGKYRKTHIPHVKGFYEKFYFRPGNLGYPVFKTDIATFGVYICYDRHFPEGARALGLNGAEIVLIPSATSRGLSEYLWHIEQRSHAVANGYFVGTINRVGKEPLGDDDFYGQSYFCDPKGYYVGEIADTRSEELIVRDLDLDTIKEVRDTWQFFRDRRPDAYEDSSGPSQGEGPASPGPPEGVPGGRPRAVTAAFAAVAVGLGLFWLGLLFVQYRSGSFVDGTWAFREEAWAFDLAAYVHAAQRLIDQGSLYAADLVAGSFQPGPADLYYYAPPLGVAMLPFTDVPLLDSSAVWWALRVGALLLACALMPVSTLLRAVAFAVVAFSLPGLKDSVLGNVSLLLLLPMVAAWRWLDRPLGSVLMAAAISLRPSLGIFLIWQLLRRRWRAALWTAGAGLVLVLVTLPFVGVHGYVDYLAVLGNLEVPLSASENRDLGGLLFRLGASSDLVAVARFASIVVAAAAVLVSLRRDPEVSYMVMLCASLLLVPLLWDHYLATLAIPAAFLGQRLWRPLVLLPLLSWLPIAAPLLVLGTMMLPFVVGTPARRTEPVALST